MKILYDYQAFTFQKFGGVSRYYAEMIEYFSEQDDPQADLSLFTSENENLQVIKNRHINNIFKGRSIPGKRTINTGINKLNSLIDIKLSKFDIFHPTYYDHYFLNHLKGKPFVITVYDTIHERYGNQYPFILKDAGFISDKSPLLEAATKVIAISQSTKKDLIKYYGLNDDKITVIYLASSKNSGIITTTRLKFDINQKFLLFIGNREYYKNFHFMLDSISAYLKRTNLLIVCGGGPPFNPEELGYIKEMEIDHLVIHQTIDDMILNQLYSKALAFIFPSLSEGFGLPVLEAMDNNCPCVLSTGGSLPEVGSEAAIYFDPLNAESILVSVIDICENPKLRKSLIESGTKRSRDFSWRKTSEDTLKLYKSIL